MADVSDAKQVILDEFVRVRDLDIKPGIRATIYLRLAEAYAWVASPNQPHGGNVQVSSGP